LLHSGIFTDVFPKLTAR